MFWRRTFRRLVSQCGISARGNLQPRTSSGGVWYNPARNVGWYQGMSHLVVIVPTLVHFGIPSMSKPVPISWSLQAIRRDRCTLVVCDRMFRDYHFASSAFSRLRREIRHLLVCDGRYISGMSRQFHVIRYQGLCRQK